MENFGPGPRANKDSFFNKMKKKPVVQAVLDDLDNYTVEQIENLNGSHFPQWIRDVLVKKKLGTSTDQIVSRAEAIAAQMNEYYMVHNTEIVTKTL